MAGVHSFVPQIDKATGADGSERQVVGRVQGVLHDIGTGEGKARVPSPSPPSRAMGVDRGQRDSKVASAGHVARDNGWPVEC